VDNSDSGEIPKTKKYLSDSMNDIYNEFCIIFSYTDNIGINKMSKCYVLNEQNQEFKYFINISRKKNASTDFQCYEYEYFNDKYQETFFPDKGFEIKNTGDYPNIDDILINALISVKRTLSVFLD